MSFGDGDEVARHLNDLGISGFPVRFFCSVHTKFYAWCWVGLSQLGLVSRLGLTLPHATLLPLVVLVRSHFPARQPADKQAKSHFTQAKL
jgi:hypothetical protein